MTGFLAPTGQAVEEKEDPEAGEELDAAVEGPSPSRAPTPPSSGAADAVSLDDAWLDAANPADLDALAQALLDGRIGDQFSRGSIQLAGFGEGAARFLDGLRGTAPRVVAWMLQRLSREHRRADKRYANVASLVWSGASEGQQAIRDTSRSSSCDPEASGGGEPEA
ncbi:MAG: hypothetical protein ABI134_22350 [Byssovorax sp.]